MTQKLETKIKDSRSLRMLFTVAFAAAYIVSEPTLSSTYFLYFTYRMQTLVLYANYAVLAVAYLLTVLQLISMVRAKEKPDTGLLLPYIAVYIGYLAATLVNPETGSMARLFDRRWETIFSYSGVDDLSGSCNFEHHLLFLPAALYRRGKGLERGILPGL